MNYAKGLFLLTFCSIALSACIPPIYNPGKMQAPFFHKQGDIEGEISYTLIEGGDAGVAYALTDDYALKAHLGIPRGADSMYQKSYSLGFGKYGVSQNKRWQLFATGGRGFSNYAGTSNTMGGDSSDPIVAKSSWWNLALEGGILWTSNTVEEAKEENLFQADLGLIGRVTFVVFDKYDFTQRFNNPPRADGSITVDNTTPKELYSEIAGLLRIGVYPAFVEFQYGISPRLFSTVPQKSYFSYNFMSAGLTICLY